MVFHPAKQLLFNRIDYLCKNKKEMITIVKRGMPKEKIKDILDRHAQKRQKTIDIAKYCGVIDIKEDPLELQKNWRDEWE